MFKKILIVIGSLFVFGIVTAIVFVSAIKKGLPEIITVADYKPLLVSPILDRNGVKVGEFFRERRTLVPFEKLPKHVVQAFLAAEDSEFYQHGGINYGAIARAMLANIRAGRSVQGGSTITQQVAKTLLLRNDEKTFLRKFQEALLSFEMEKNLKKEEILYLYLNQIFFGHGAYGIQNASQTYFRKSVEQLTLEEAALLAGLPQAPSRYSPVSNPKSAKNRQRYVLRRMAAVGYVSDEEAEKAAETPVRVFIRQNFEELAPFYRETVRQLLVNKLGEKTVLDEGISIQLAMDLKMQEAAQESLKKGLKELDKRQGFRGPDKNLQDEDSVIEVLAKEKQKLILATNPGRTILPTGEFAEIQEAKNGISAEKIPSYMQLGENYTAVVREVNDPQGYVHVLMAGAEGLIDFDTLKWARKPDTSVKAEKAEIQKPSDALKVGDVIQVVLKSDKINFARWNDPKTKKFKPPFDVARYINVELDQEPLVEAALVSFDQQTQEILALVGGYDFRRNEFNRALQAARQTGSSFKTIVYTAALDKGYNPSTEVLDVPLVYEEKQQDEEGQEETKLWKPSNHGRDFSGEIIFRNALVQSLNIPTVKIIEDIGVPWSADYARRLGIFSPLNMDFTLGLGSSSVTLYEMTKVFSQLGRLGKRIRPLIIKSVKDSSGQIILENLSLDIRFEKEISALEQEFEEKRLSYINSLNVEPPTEGAAPVAEAKPVDKKKTDPYLFFENPDQLIKPQTAYVITSILKGVIEDPKGTGARARALGREVAGKTGSTNGYFDAWFIGYTAQISTGVWVGYDKEKSIGRGEVGGRAALPIWLEYMKSAHNDLPQMTLPVPEGIVFANIDGDSGKLASAESKVVIRQAYLEGSEPTSSSNKEQENSDFLKQDF
jgi:penicillin-binding protein 1A